MVCVWGILSYGGMGRMKLNVLIDKLRSDINSPLRVVLVYNSSEDFKVLSVESVEVVKE